MDFQQLADVAEKWCSNTPFELIATEETERRMDFYADPGVSFYVLCPDNGCGDNFHVWSESEDCLPFLQLAQDYISSCGKKTLHEVLEKVFKSFRPLLGLPDTDDDAFEEYSADVEEEGPEADHPQMGEIQRAAGLAKRSTCWESDTPQLHSDESSCAQDPSRPRPMYLFIWLFICILYNKPENVSKVFFCFL
uniref:Maturin n=1 Tax=Equus caballus TaxID=9796 RepID=A0A9L0RKF6_HORSE